jgi:hypothetical protein
VYNNRPVTMPLRDVVEQIVRHLNLKIVRVPPVPEKLILEPSACEG